MFKKKDKTKGEMSKWTQKMFSGDFLVGLKVTLSTFGLD